MGSGERRGVGGAFFRFPAQIPGCSDHGQNVGKLEVPSAAVAKQLSRRQGQEAPSRARGPGECSAQRPALGKAQIYFLM